MKKTGSKVGKPGKNVNLQLAVKPGSEVFVAGTFNDWDPKQHRMSDNPGSGHCKITLVLPPGRHEYKFVVDGEWLVDPNCPESVPNAQGSLNSVLTV